MKYVIIAYLRNVKGYHYPYDFYICSDYSTFLKNIEVVKKLLDIKYSYFEVYKQLELDSKGNFKL